MLGLAYPPCLRRISVICGPALPFVPPPSAICFGVSAFPRFGVSLLPRIPQRRNKAICNLHFTALAQRELSARPFQPEHVMKKEGTKPSTTSIHGPRQIDNRQSQIENHQVEPIF